MLNADPNRSPPPQSESRPPERDPLPGLSPDTRLAIPGTPAWDAQFGRGWTLYVLASMSAIAVSFVFLARASTPIARVQGLAIVGGLFAAGFFGAISYHAIGGIGLPFGFYRGKRLIQQRVIHPATYPLGYPLLIGLFLSLCLASIVAAGWMYLRADAFAGSLSHSGR